MNLLEARQCRGRRPVRQSDRVADLGRLEFLDAGNDEADFAGGQAVALQRFGSEYADLLAQKRAAGGHQADPVFGLQTALHDSHQHHHANIVIEPGVDDQGLQGAAAITLRRRHPRDHRFDHVENALAGLGAGAHRVMGINTDHVFDLGNGVVRVGRGQIDLVEHRHDFNAKIKCRIAIGDRLRLNALRRVNHQQGALAGRQGATDLIRKINMPGRVDQVEVVFLAVPRGVMQGGGLGLDGDPALPLKVH